MDEEIRPHRAKELGDEREVIVLDPRHGSARPPLGLVGDRVRETEIDRAIPIPELPSILEIVNEHVAQRPQGSIRESVIVRVHFVIFEPDASQGVRLFVRWHLHATGFVGRFHVRGSRSPRDPGAMDASHGWIERGHESASGLLDLDAAGAPDVLIRLAIRDKDEFAVAEILEDVRHSRRVWRKFSAAFSARFRARRGAHGP